MNIDVKMGTGKGQCKVSINGNDVSNRLTEISINKSGITIPEVIMKFIPDECNVAIDAQFISIDRGLWNYSQEELSKEITKRISNTLNNM